MLAGEQWESLVPEAVIEVIDEIKGIERLEAVSRKSDIGDYEL
jgi:nicotinamide-nucleotide adenylyltransferase